MSGNEATAVQAVLGRFARGEASVHELAAALESLDGLVVVASPGDTLRFLQDMDAALREKGIGNVQVSDAENPRPFGSTDADGRFTPRAFTGDDLARECLAAAGLIEPDDVLVATHRAPDHWAHECLSRGWAGCVLDDGAAHRVALDRAGLARLYALLSLEGFAGFATLCVIGREGKPFLQRTKDGAGIQAFVYPQRRIGEGVLARSAQQLPGAAILEIDAGRLLDGLLRAGTTRLMVDYGTPLARWYDRDDLASLAERRRAAQAGPTAATTATTHASRSPDMVRPPAIAAQVPGPAAAPAPEPAAPRAVAGAAVSAGPPAPPPGRDDDTSHAALRRLFAALADHAVVQCEFLETLGFELDFYAIGHPERMEGLAWPHLFRHPEDAENTVALLYSREDLARRLSESPPPSPYHHLSGIEALRWIWAAPAAITGVVIDLGVADGKYLTIPAFWALELVYPQWVEIPSFEGVPGAALPELGKLPGARGLKPRVVQALSTRWKALYGSAGPDGAPGPEIAFGGGSYVPVFTGPETFFDYGATDAGFRGRPVPAGGEPPFLAWFRAALRCDGVVIDPGGASPLTLDPTDLLLLHLWASGSGRQPRGPEIVAAVALLHAEGIVDRRIAARLLADWPEYFVALRPSPDGNYQILTLPGRDLCPMFSSETLAERYLDHLRQSGSLDEGIRPVSLTHRLHVSAFHQGARNFAEGVWIDPDPQAPEAGGIHLAPEALTFGIGRIAEQLTPRIPGFVESRVPA